MGLIIDLVTEGVVAASISNQILAASTQGTALLGDNAEISLNMIAIVNVPTAANVTSLQIQAEESTQSASTGTWTVIPSVNGNNMTIVVTATTATSNTTQLVRGLRTLAYYRANAITLAAATTTGAFPTTVVFVSMKHFAQGVGNQSGVDRYPSN